MSSFMIVLILVFVCLVIFAALSDESRVSGFGSPSPGMKSDFEISRNNKQFIRLQRNFERLVESEKRKGAGLFQSDAEKLTKKASRIDQRQALNFNRMALRRANDYATRNLRDRINNNPQKDKF